MAGSAGEAPLGQDAKAGIYTATLAGLYLKQGFVEHALTIYRRLALEQPENQQLHERLHTLEQQLALGVLGQEAAAQSPLPDRAAGTPPRAPQHHAQRVMAPLERWLRYLQRQRQLREPP